MPETTELTILDPRSGATVGRVPVDNALGHTFPTALRGPAPARRQPTTSTWWLTSAAAPSLERAQTGAKAIMANGAGSAGLADGQVQRQTVTSIAMGETP
ncbi:hypothetical protein [Mycobacterium persicum]|uniref:hypothetical protein n=1 Tax=Mycobacterium persicum TaxID=1487726 RepID=UPI0009F1A09B|nr:hypothetical protein [Mycobacterium persicum]ORB32915.1 hypothetical protein BST40_27250 [Mycobacterium persicum]ORB91423.1 hypothetical protein B1T49_21790 [Mycobacterium persicum]ORC03425.1 hypothetical protein B1T48_21505 [Mycobacterium persicum]